MQPEPATADDLQSVLRHACAELRRRLLAGEDCQAEQFLHAHPSLVTNPDAALAVIRAEWQARHDAGRQLSSEQWHRRFPAWSAHISGWLAGNAPPQHSTADAALTVPVAGSSSGPPAPLQSLDHHLLHEQIGQGGMGTVYRAWDPVLKRHVALKKIRAGVLADEGEVARFYREARAAAQLHHPNVVPIHGMGLHQGEHCFTMTLAPETLEKQKKRFQADVGAAVALVEAVARGVQAAHDKNIIHRDLKPANILLDDTGQPLVGDFGLAKVCDAGAGDTLPGVIMGTAAYMAPEQAAGRTWEVGKASDVWALGVILYELLTGRRPFEGEKAKDVLPQVLNEEPPRPRALEPSLDRDLEAVVLRCLQKRPSRRYSSAAALADDLERCPRSETVLGCPTSWPRRLGRAVRRRSPLLTISFLTLVSGAALLVLLFRPDRATHDLPDRTPLHLLGRGGIQTEATWVLGAGTVTALDGETVRLESGGKEPGLLQVLTAPPWDRYRFRAQVQDLGGSRSVGLFLGHQVRPVAHGREHWFFEFSFAEKDEHLPPQGGIRHAGASLRLRRRANLDLTQMPSFDRQELVSPYRYFRATRGRWRWLTFEVTPDMLCAYWEEEPQALMSLPCGAALEAVRNRLARRPVPDKSPLPPSVRGGLGFFCEGVALIRRATVAPLAAAP